MATRPVSLGFTKTELQAFATAGIRDRVRDIERELHRIQATFPGVLRQEEPIVLLAAEERPNGKPWPPLTAKSEKTRASWTPARRKQQAARLRKNQARLQAGKRAKRTPTAKRTGPVLAWQRMQAALRHAPNQQATAKELREATKLTSVNICNAWSTHRDVFKRVKPGVYALTAAGQNGAAADA